MRLETTHAGEAAGGLDALAFGLAGIASGVASWLVPAPGFLAVPIPTGMTTANINVFPALIFVVSLAAALFITRLPGRMEQNLTNWIIGAVATVGIYAFVVGLLFFGYFWQLFNLQGSMLWLNFALCGAIGAGLIAMVTGTVAGKMASGIFLTMLICGALSGLAPVASIFLFPWWQGTMGFLIGLWFQQAATERVI